MSITITIPAELEPLVIERANASGKNVEEYALDLLKRDAELPDPWDLFADVRADIQARGITDEEIERDIDEAVAEVRARRRA